MGCLLPRQKLMKISIIVCSLGYVALMLALSTGITRQTRKPGSNQPVGCTCHSSSPSSSVNVSIIGPDSMALNQTKTFTLRMTGGPAVRGGTNIAASSGTLTPVSSTLQKIGAELTHKSPTPFASGALEFQFTYTSPATQGVQTLYANGNSVNNNGSSTGDQWNFAPNKTITVSSSVTAVDDEEQPQSFILHQNYPNPFNPSTTISYRLSGSSHVFVRVHDLSGKIISTLVDEIQHQGDHRILFDGSGLASGTYMYILSVGESKLSKRMTLVK